MNVSELRGYKRHLSNNNIESVIFNEHQANTPGAPSVYIEVKAELWVKQDYLYAEAMRQIRKHCAQREANTKKVELVWGCENCNEENPGTFELCWSCGESNDLQTSNK